MTKHIHAIETGLSSDPPMNWRLSGLDRFALVSNSDCHSFWPWRLGREANVFELEKPSYREIVDSIRMKDNARFRFTVETDPAYGKYHWTGHRRCNVSLSPKEAIRFSNICPVCRRRLTKGVEQRIEELADRPSGYVRQNVTGFRRLLPLSDIIAAAVGARLPSDDSVWNEFNKLTAKFGSELSVLLDTDQEALATVVNKRLVDAIVRVREGKITVQPGYDGVYGRLVLFEENETGPKPVRQSILSDYS
jgi:uncharacterized protein (TIGR00375 family)